MVADGVAGKSARETVELAAERGVQIVREHGVSIGRGQKLVNAPFGELEKAIQLETVDDKDCMRGVL